jgi:hypothetical protein
MRAYSEFGNTLLKSPIARSYLICLRLWTDRLFRTASKMMPRT